MSFDMAVLLRLSRLNVFQTDTFPSGPALQSGADVFRVVVTTDLFEATAPSHYLLQTPHYALGGKRKVGFNARAFSVKVINHIQQAYAASILQLVVHEVIDHTWFMASGTASDSCFSRFRRLRGLMCKFSSNSR